MMEDDDEKVQENGQWAIGYMYCGPTCLPPLQQ